MCEVLAKAILTLWEQHTRRVRLVVTSVQSNEESMVFNPHRHRRGALQSKCAAQCFPLIVPWSRQHRHHRRTQDCPAARCRQGACGRVCRHLHPVRCDHRQRGEHLRLGCDCPVAQGCGTHHPRQSRSSCPPPTGYTSDTHTHAHTGDVSTRDVNKSSLCSTRSHWGEGRREGCG